MNKNLGIDWDLEMAHQQPDKDWVAGLDGISCITDVIPEGHRDQYFPLGEVQRGVEDFMDCATRGPLNKYEAKFNYCYQTMLPLFSEALKQWLRDNGFVGEDGLITFSDRYIAIRSHTTRSGNSLKAPLEATRKGLIPKKMLPASADMTFDEYHDPSAITPEMDRLAAEFAKRFQLNYARVYSIEFKKTLVKDSLIVAGYAWPDEVDGIYPPVPYPANHCFVLVRSPFYEAFDNYIDESGTFYKTLSPEYSFQEYGYRAVITKASVPSSNWLTDLFRSIFLLK